MSLFQACGWSLVRTATVVALADPAAVAEAPPGPD